MSQLTSSKPTPKANPVELTAAAVNYVVRSLPSGTAYCIGIVLIVMMTGRLVQSQGSQEKCRSSLGLSSQVGMASSRKGNGKREGIIRWIV
ncbi:MAG: hypothetical protein AB4426_31760 [Xenococcaceae cyanobacterium]